MRNHVLLQRSDSSIHSFPLFPYFLTVLLPVASSSSLLVSTLPSASSAFSPGLSVSPSSWPPTSSRWLCDRINRCWRSWRRGRGLRGWRGCYWCSACSGWRCNFLCCSRSSPRSRPTPNSAPWIEWSGGWFLEWRWCRGWVWCWVW